MPRKGRSDAADTQALHQVEGGEKVIEVFRRLGVSEQTFYRWKKRFSGLGLQEQTALFRGPVRRSLRQTRTATAETAQIPHWFHLCLLSAHRLRSKPQPACFRHPGRRWQGGRTTTNCQGLHPSD
jgi:transposase-like protein